MLGSKRPRKKPAMAICGEIRYNPVMNFKKVRELVDATVFLDIKHADDQELRVNYLPGDDDCWFEIMPEKYKREEDLAAIINAKAQLKLQSRSNSPFGNRKS